MIDGTSGSSNNNNNDNNLDKDGSICDNEGSSELIQCKPDKIFPLDNEKEEDLHYPITTYHYSVSNNARYVYVIGEESNETNSQLFVWDLHRGTSRRYTLINLPLAAQLKHLYEINSQDGMLLSRNLQCFFVHLIQFNHSKQLIEVHDVLYRQHINHSHFWSSARISSGQGIIFMSQHNISRNFFIAKVIPNAPVQSVFLTAQMAGLHFCGQPWVHGDFMYLFESTSSINFAEIKYLTGRLVRANLTTGELEMIHTKATGFIKDSLPSMKEDINLLLEDENANIPFSLREMEHTTIIRRVKHVERSGWLWIIAEFMDSFSTYNSINSHCEICVLKMESLTWYRLDWLPGCRFDELTLDVTSSGTVVLLRKKFLESTNQAQIDSFLFLYKNPESLLTHSFRALIMSYPHYRNLDTKQLRILGIPTHFFDS